MAIFQNQRSVPVRPGFKYHLKVHSFRTMTAVLSWALIALAFYEKPEYLTGMQRVIQRGIEWIGDAIPSPWGPRVEFIAREIGGIIWLQITVVIITLRVALSGLAMHWRFSRGRDAT